MTNTLSVCMTSRLYYTLWFLHDATLFLIISHVKFRKRPGVVDGHWLLTVIFIRYLITITVSRWAIPGLRRANLNVESHWAR